MSIGIILGSSFADGAELAGTLTPEPVHTAHGDVVLHRAPRGVFGPRQVWVLFRHGLPHRYLPHQIPYRAHALALQQVGVQALLVTSSVGLLDPELPLGQPMLVRDLLMPDNRLPDGSTCTIFTELSSAQGHLVLDEGLFSVSLAEQLRACARQHAIGLGPEVVFAYVGGPRTKTAAENAFWRAMGAQVNSMTLGPEVVLANELEIPAVALVVGHKPSGAHGQDDVSQSTVRRSLHTARQALEELVWAFASEAEPPGFANHVYRFSRPTAG